MATEITFIRLDKRQGDFKTDEAVDGIVSRVNRALKADEKFITVTQADGKKRGLEVARVLTIQETD
jgi:hypothetical protein